MLVDTIKRLPLYSLGAGAILAAVLLVFAISGVRIPGVGLGALGLLPLAAALVDAVRLRRKFGPGGPGQGGPGQGGPVQGGPGQGGPVQGGEGQGSGDEDHEAMDETDLKEWLEERSESLTSREQELNARALALQQWMQFPDVLDFQQPSTAASITSSDSVTISNDDPMARHDRELFELIEVKTRELFDSIKLDAYRKDQGDRKVFDNQRIRTDVVALVADVAAIYRPGETSPLLKTNVEAISRAVGRASLRLLVAVENLPGGLASYDFQSIYNMVIGAVKTFGMYKSAKPYIDIASGVLFAGRIVSSTNPITLVAWWAASKATTYGASKLGGHVLDQQAVGLIRQMVEIVAVEVASVYSPMVRYRDVHWIYGVELVHLASELAISDSARIEAMKQLSVLNLRDEYGRVSLMRHLAGGSTSKPANYHPSDSLSAADRMVVAQRLESFMLTHVMNDAASRTAKSAIDAWQTATAERLEIQLQAGAVDATEEEQTQRAIWSLAAFALEHLNDERDQAIDRLHMTQTWNTADSQTRTRWIRELQSAPPFLYDPPIIEPESDICRRYLSDLVEMAASLRKPQLTLSIESSTDGTHVDLMPWPGEDAIRVTAYFLRSDAPGMIGQYQGKEAARLLANSSHKNVAPELVRALEYFADGMGSGQDAGVRCVFCDATRSDTGQTVNLARIGSSIVCFTAELEPPSRLLRVAVHDRCELPEADINKVAGYVRSDCRVRFPDGTEVILPGSALRSYDSYFANLLTAN